MHHIVRAVISSLWLMAVILLGSCGNGLPHSSEVALMVTPAEATVATGGTISLNGDATGFTRSPIVRWWIEEAHDAGGDDCGYFEPPPTSPCKYGYVTFVSVTQFPSSATYYAPSQPGTYHVTFQATQSSEFDYLQKTAASTITVTP
jgi:hypothetical protein